MNRSMNINDLPSIGERIEIVVTDNSMKIDDKQQLISQILDVIDENHFFIAIPIVNNILVPIPVGAVIKVEYYKKNSAFCSFKAKVLSRKNVDNLSYMKVERISEISKKQRRDFYRFNVVLDCEIKEINPEGEVSDIYKGLTKDISGGGVRIIANKRFEVNSILQLTINTGKEEIVVNGRVIRCISHEDLNYEFEMALVFDDIDEKTRTKIVSFIFECQRNMKKKGLV